MRADLPLSVRYNGGPLGHGETVTQQVRHLAGAYFPQDYDLDSDSPDSVSESFRKGEGEASAAELISEIDRLLGSPLSETRRPGRVDPHFDSGHHPGHDWTLHRRT